MNNPKFTAFDNKTFLAAMRPGGTRVPIPNTRVKARAADGTALETVWESRRLPETKKKEVETPVAGVPGETLILLRLEKPKGVL